MYAAATNGHEACVRVLIAANADVSYANGDGETALHYAASNSSICRVLIDEGVSLNVNAMDEKGETALELAKKYGNAECVAILEAAGAV